MNVSPIIKYRTLNMARALAPIDTGNLRYNAINIRKNNKNKWTINYSSKQAFYIAPLQEGWTDKRTGKTHDMHKGFINNTVILLTNYLYDYLSGSRSNKYFKYRGMANDTGNTWKREMVNLRSKMLYAEYNNIQKKGG